ncbi:MAG: hypothetical protein RLZZ11_932, partial [Cyanobacteriota bacterium]
MFEHHLQSRVPLQQGLEVALDEHGFAIKDVHRWIGHLPVDQQGHADALHAGEHRGDVGEIAHAGIGVGGGSSRVELRCGEHPGRKACFKLGRRALQQPELDCPCRIEPHEAHVLLEMRFEQRIPALGGEL